MVRSAMAVNYYYLVLLVACCAYAGARGAAPERIGVGIVAAGAILTYVAVITSSIHYSSVEIWIFGLDVVTFLAFVLLALRANRFWTLWVSALLGIGLLGHFAMLLHPRVIPWAYAVVLSIWSYPILLLIAVGTFAHRRRLTRNGADPSWTRSSGPPGPPTPPPGPKP
jgi:hypothetical protein